LRILNDRATLSMVKQRRVPLGWGSFDCWQRRFASMDSQSTCGQAPTQTSKIPPSAVRVLIVNTA
jgi:hypothetical protein